MRDHYDSMMGIALPPALVYGHIRLNYSRGSDGTVRCIFCAQPLSVHSRQWLQKSQLDQIRPWNHISIDRAKLGAAGGSYVDKHNVAFCCWACNLLKWTYDHPGSSSS